MTDKKIVQIPAFDLNHFMTGEVFRLSGPGMRRKMMGTNASYDHPMYGILVNVTPTSLLFRTSYVACDGGDIRFQNIAIDIHDYEDDVNIEFMITQ